MSAARVLLVADDEPLIVEAICDIVSVLKNVKVITACDGKDSLEKIEANQVDAVISDINMPRMTGLQTLTEIRQKGFETPFIILTGYGDKKNMVEALRLGATDFLEKPFDDDELLKIAENALELGAAINAVVKQLKQLVTENKLPAADFENIKNAKTALIKIRMNSRVKKD